MAGKQRGGGTGERDRAECLWPFGHIALVFKTFVFHVTELALYVKQYDTKEAR